MDALGFINLKSLGIFLEKTENGTKVKKESPSKGGTNGNDGPNSEITIGKTSISGYYRTDLNLVELNAEVLKIIDTQTKETLEKQLKIKEDELRKVQLYQNKIERETSIRSINLANEEIKKCEGSAIKDKYVADITKILNEYIKIGVLKQYFTFGRNYISHNIEESDERKMHRLSLIEKFLDIVGRFVYINISRKSNSNGCPSCGYPLPKIDNSDGDNPACINCSTEIIQLSAFIPSTDPIPVKKTNNNSEGRNNFIKELQRYQGKLKNVKFPNNLEQLLDEYFVMTGSPTGSQVKTDSTLMSKTNKALMYKALKDTGMNKLYKDINLVCHSYWGWGLIDLENIEDEIMRKYDQIYEIYEILKADNKDERSSSLNSQYVLWWILDNMEFECSPSDFKIPKTPEIFEYYEKTREEISNQLGWDFYGLKIDCIV